MLKIIKQYLKLYLISFFTSFFCIAIPWLLSYLNVISSYVTEHFLPTSAVALLISGFIVFKFAKKVLAKIVLLLLNPAVWYVIFRLCNQ